MTLTMEGRLKKRTMFKTWRTNYYKVVKNRLCLYKGAGDPVPSKVYLLPTEANSEEFTGAVELSDLYDNCFRVKTASGKVLTLLAENAVQRTAWIKAIESTTVSSTQKGIGSPNVKDGHLEYVGGDEILAMIVDAHALAIQEDAELRGEWEDIKPALELKAQSQSQYCKMLANDLATVTAEAIASERSKSSSTRSIPIVHSANDGMTNSPEVTTTESITTSESSEDSESSEEEEEGIKSTSTRSLWKNCDRIQRDLLQAQIMQNKQRLQIMFPAVDGFLCSFGSSARIGFRDFYLDTLKCNFTFKIEPPGRAFLRAEGMCSLRLDGVNIRGDKGSRVPKKDYKFLEMEIHYELVLPFRYMDSAAVLKWMAETKQQGNPFARWEAGKGYSIEVTRLEGVRGTKMPTFTLKSILNKSLSGDRMKEMLRNAIMPELGSLLSRCTGGKCGLAIAVGGSLHCSGFSLDLYSSSLVDDAAIEMLGLSSSTAAILHDVAAQILGQTSGSGRAFKRVEVTDLLAYFTRFANATNWSSLRRLWKQKLNDELSKAHFGEIEEAESVDKLPSKFPFENVLLCLQKLQRKTVKVKYKIDQFFFSGAAGKLLRSYKNASLRWCEGRHDPARLAQLHYTDRPKKDLKVEISEICKRYSKMKKSLKWIRTDWLRDISVPLFIDLTGGHEGKLQVRMADVRLNTALTDLSLELQLLDLRVRTLSLLSACRTHVNSGFPITPTPKKSSSSLFKSALRRGLTGRRRRMTIAEKWAEARLRGIENALRDGAKLDMRVVIDGGGRMAFETGHCVLNCGRALAGLQGEMRNLNFGAAALPLLQDLLGRSRIIDAIDDAIPDDSPLKSDDTSCVEDDEDRKQSSLAEMRSWLNQVIDMLDKYVCSAKVMQFRMQMFPSVTVSRGQVKIFLEPSDPEVLRNCYETIALKTSTSPTSKYMTKRSNRGLLHRYRKDSLNSNSSEPGSSDVILCAKCHQSVEEIKAKEKVKKDEENKVNAKIANEAQRIRINAFYTKYNPSKLDEPTFIPELLLQYKGYEDVLMDQLVSKYGPEPTEELVIHDEDQIDKLQTVKPTLTDTVVYCDNILKRLSPNGNDTKQDEKVASQQCVGISSPAVRLAAQRSSKHRHSTFGHSKTISGIHCGSSGEEDVLNSNGSQKSLSSPNVLEPILVNTSNNSNVDSVNMDKAMVTFENEISLLDLLEDGGLTLAPRRLFLPPTVVTYSNK